MITVIKPLIPVHEWADNLCACPLQAMTLVLSTVIHNYRTTWRKNTWLESCHPLQLTTINCHIFLHVLCKLTSTSMFLLEMMMPAQNDMLCMTLGNTHEIKKILKYVAWYWYSKMFYIKLGKSMKFLQIQWVLWISDITLNY